MSTQKGNCQRSRPQKYKNNVGFKNTLHDNSSLTKRINSLTMECLCSRCAGILEWRVKYKKYHPLNQPKTCVKCGSKAVKRAYYTICLTCATSLSVCAKCGSHCETLSCDETRKQEEINAEFEARLHGLRERERRTLLRIAEAKHRPHSPGRAKSSGSGRRNAEKPSLRTVDCPSDSSCSEPECDSDTCK